MQIREKHPRAIRWLHWIHFPLLMLMIWTGTLIYWANPIYLPLPPSIVRILRIDHRLAEGMAWHFFIMWFFALNGFAYVIYLAISGEWREIIPLPKSHRPSPKFSYAQRFAYTGILLMGLGSLTTGLAIYKPVQLGWITEFLGGYEAARFEHFALTVGFILFFVVHVIQVARAGWNHFRAMVAGYARVQK